jgi:DNA-binding HxlR family transcriptional regulator
VDVSLKADQKRQQNQAAYNAALEGCHARQLLETISSKWVTLVLLELAEGPRRHSELRRRIPGASQKMLTSTLRMLERDGLVLRRVTPSVPVRTDYELTQLGRSLLGVLYGLKDWAEESMHEVESARLGYDQAPRDGVATLETKENSFSRFLTYRP